MKKYHAICDQLYNSPHLILREKLDEITNFIERRVAGDYVIDDDSDGDGKNGPELYYVTAAGEHFAPVDRPAKSAGGGLVAVVPLFGTMFQHAGFITNYSGGISTQSMGNMLDELDADPDVKAILIEIHSPGGQVWGTLELAGKLFEIRRRGETKTVAIANSLAASAALWVATAAGEFVATPGGEVGSIGVLTMHQDISRLEENSGIKTTLIATPPEKIEGHPYAPLPDDVRGRLSKETADIYRTFRDFVAAYRNVSPEYVETNFGGGRMLPAAEAAKVGLIDRVITFDAILDELRGLAGELPRGRGNRNRLALAEAGS